MRMGITARQAWRKQKHRFGQIHLRGNRLHLGIRQPGAIFEHRQRVATKPGFGKYIHQMISTGVVMAVRAHKSGKAQAEIVKEIGAMHRPA